MEENGLDASAYLSVNKVTFKGITYYVGNHIITGFCNDEPVMPRITHLLVKNDTVVILGKYYTGLLNSHLRAYELRELSTSGLTVYNINDLVDKIPLDAYRIRGRLYCVLKHYVSNSQY